ncbi:hypothetical protein HA402_008075 [Bradysia odoriphaga]|nr:hypothetical protein HA402_008075 [Bradysia odoriphaga]
MAPVNVDIGHEKANSSNLPVMSIQMLAEFFNRTTMYVNNESSGVKAGRSMGSKYGDEAIGRVQVKHTKTSCNVIASVTPEHKIKDQPYKVVVNIDVKNQKVKSAECKGCMAALGGCKHAIALIGWIHRRSEEPSQPKQCAIGRSQSSQVLTHRSHTIQIQMNHLHTQIRRKKTAMVSFLRLPAESEKLKMTDLPLSAAL